MAREISEETQDEPALLRHGDHDPEIVCRPAGNGLCEPLDQDEARRFAAWQEMVRLGQEIRKAGI